MCAPDVMTSVHATLRRHPVTRRNLLGAAAFATAGALAPTSLLGQVATPVATPVATGGTATWTTVTNLSHANSPATPLWPGSPAFAMETVVTIENDGFYGNVLTFHEHTGTHMDTPGHFFTDGATADRIDPSRLVAPLVVIDITAQAEADVDYGLTVDDIMTWEAEYGPIPAGALVTFTSGWDARIDDAEAFVNVDADGVMHFPGFSPTAAEFLVAERNIVGIGSDTLSQDPGNSTDFGTHVAILGAGKYGIEGVASLGSVPASGATVVVGAANHVNGSGGPARLLALY
jgi:kynurenine formamidase